MTMKSILFLTASVLASSLMSQNRGLLAQSSEQSMVRFAELEIDPAQLESYRLALQEEIETSVRIEPGVVTLYAVSVKGHPEQIRLFEEYRNEAAYRAHLQSPHFKKYKTQTESMVKSLRLIETDPILLRSKTR